MSQTVLIVDDDHLIRDVLTALLKNEGFDVQCARNSKEALRLVQRHPPDMAIVDVELGENDSGLNLLGVWKHSYHFPTMVLSSRGKTSDRVTGLELGASDYIVKPFDPRELVLRLKIMSTRITPHLSPQANKLSWRVGDYIFDASQRSLHRGLVKTLLSPFESSLLAYLSSRANTVVTREQILDALQSRDKEVNDRSVDVLIGRLRKKLNSDVINIQSVRGLGYQLSGVVTVH